jgi:hypothetical protein
MAIKVVNKEADFIKCLFECENIHFILYTGMKAMTTQELK